MSIDSWILLWKVLLVVGIGLFAILATCVTVGGFFDVQKLFRVLRQQHAEQATLDNASREQSDASS